VGLVKRTNRHETASVLGARRAAADDEDNEDDCTARAQEEVHGYNVRVDLTAAQQAHVVVGRKEREQPDGENCEPRQLQCQQNNYNRPIYIQ